jgi:aspartate racemase
MHMGLIGGIGPATTVAYYRRMVDAFARAETSLRFTVEHADIAVLTDNARQMGGAAQAEAFLVHYSATITLADTVNHDGR